MIKSENYITIQGFMRTDLNLKGNELLTYAIIYGFSQEENCVFTGSANYIAEWLGIRKRNALEVLKRLTDKGLIVKHKKLINGITLCDYEINRKTLPVMKHHQGGDETSSGGGDVTSPHILDIDILEDKLVKKENTKEKEELSKDFEDWYKEYPRKIGKALAKKCYLKVRGEGIAKEVLTKGVSRYNNFINANKTELRYIKHPSTWLNQGCWDDEYTVQAPTKNKFPGLF